jgi:energy-coupling factor transporter ATP-binding protein EcfA2
VAPDAVSPAVLVDGLTFSYGDAETPALHGIDLTLRGGEITLLVGPTAAGKSTLYQCLNGLIPHQVQGMMSGSVQVTGKDTQEHSIADLAQRVGTVFQDPEVQIFSLSVEDELAFGPENLCVPREEIARRVHEAASIVRLRDLLDREPARLSGGQKQSVAIGAVWTMLPDVLILDEPTSNLDPQGSLRVVGLLRRLNAEFGKTILVAEHKIDLLAPVAHRVVVLCEGRIVLEGPPREVFRRVDVLHPLGVRGPVASEVYLDLVGDPGPDRELPLTVEECLAAVEEWMRGRVGA